MGDQPGPTIPGRAGPIGHRPPRHHRRHRRRGRSADRSDRGAARSNRHPGLVVHRIGLRPPRPADRLVSTGAGRAAPDHCGRHRGRRLRQRRSRAGPAHRPGDSLLLVDPQPAGVRRPVSFAGPGHGAAGIGSGHIGIRGRLAVGCHRARRGGPRRGGGAGSQNRLCAQQLRHHHRRRDDHGGRGRRRAWPPRRRSAPRWPP